MTTTVKLDWRTSRVPDVVTELNYEIWEATRGRYDDKFKLLYNVNGAYECVSFLSQVIWDNKDISIPWDEKAKAPKFLLKDFLLFRMMEEVEALRTALLPVLTIKRSIRDGG